MGNKDFMGLFFPEEFVKKIEIIERMPCAVEADGIIQRTSCFVFATRLLLWEKIPQDYPPLKARSEIKNQLERMLAPIKI